MEAEAKEALMTTRANSKRDQWGLRQRWFLATMIFHDPILACRLSCNGLDPDPPRDRAEQLGTEAAHRNLMLAMLIGRQSAAQRLSTHSSPLAAGSRSRTDKRGRPRNARHCNATGVIEACFFHEALKALPAPTFGRYVPWRTGSRLLIGQLVRRPLPPHRAPSSIYTCCVEP